MIKERIDEESSTETLAKLNRAVPLLNTVSTLQLLYCVTWGVVPQVTHTDTHTHRRRKQEGGGGCSPGGRGAERQSDSRSIGS